MKRQIFMVMLAILLFGKGEASAFWGRDSSDPVSGLNVAAGFDVNTMTTFTGTVLTPPGRQGDAEHTVMAVVAPQGVVNLLLGPWWYWEKEGMAISKDQELVMTGSLAQGKDGALYLFVQRLENRGNGESLQLRSESGAPLWSRSGPGMPSGNRPGNGSGPRSGPGSRSGGMRGGRR